MRGCREGGVGNDYLQVVILHSATWSWFLNNPSKEHLLVKITCKALVACSAAFRRGIL